MKLINHVLKIRSLVQQSIDNRFSKMGLKEDGVIAIDQLPESLIEKRGKLEDILNNHLEELKDYAKARQETINECTFTLFNRIAAIKVMEDKELFPEVIRRRPENGNKSFAHNLWLEEHPEEKSSERQGLKHFLQDKFNELGEHFPLYNEKYPYAIMPTADELYNILEAFNEVENDPDCGADIWEGDDILGWLYENFNATEKEMLKESGEKTEYDKVSLQSQVYTPQWVVKFLVDNTLGKLYLEMFPDSDLVRPDENGTVKYQIANAPKTRTREPKKMEELRVIDPACGSGNFLIYTFSLLYDMYVNQVEQYGADYSKRDIPKLIIENNIYGVDLDERAVQLSQIALYVKAREIGGRRAQVPQHTNVVSTHFFLPDFEEVASAFDSDGEWDSKQMEIIRKIWADLQNAYKFGTLVRIEEVLNSLTPNDASDSLFADQEADNLFSFKRRVTDILREQVSKYCSENSTEYALTKANDAMAFLGILSMPFDVAVANPPYTYSRDYGEDLKSFVDENYSHPYNVGTNLYSCFVCRCYELLSVKGMLGTIHPKTFMSIAKFKEFRSFLLNNTSIVLFIDWGFLGIFPPSVRVDSAFYTLKKEQLTADSIFIKLDDLYEGIRYKHFVNSYNMLLAMAPDKLRYCIKQQEFFKIKTSPFIYWISDEFRKLFSGKTLSEEFDICNGISSGGNNEQFYRFFWEVDKSDIMSATNVKNYKWVTINKGGDANKWYGNQWLVFEWENEGEKLKNLKELCPSIRYGYEEYYFKQGLAFNGSGKSLAVRIQPEYCLFERAGKSIYSKKPCDYYELMAILNSKLCSYIMGALNSTISFQSGDLERMPYRPLDNKLLSFLSNQNVEIKKYLSRFSIIEPLFEESPIKIGIPIKDSVFQFFSFENALNTIVLLNESFIDAIIFKEYGLSTNDINMVLDKEGRNLFDYPVSQKSIYKFVSYLNTIDHKFISDDLLENISHISSIDENIPEIDFSSIYQSNNGWEKFCQRNSINPIEAWCQFQDQKIIPENRVQTLCFELMTCSITKVLKADDDGIIPLCDKAGEERLNLRIENELMAQGYTPAQFNQICQLLGGDINHYLKDSYFQQLSNHLNLFDHMAKTPFIWHISSGPLHVLDIYICIYNWSRNSLFRIKSVYIANRESFLKDQLMVISSDDVINQMKKNDIIEEMSELKIFASRIDTLLSSGYNPDIDGGVGKNIAPLQAAGLLSFDVLNEKQLKVYLSANW